MSATYILSPDARQVACRRCGGEKTDPYGGRCQTCYGRGYFRERIYRRVAPEVAKVRAILLVDRENNPERDKAANEATRRAILV